MLCEGLHLAIGGGTQMYNIVRSLAPMNVGMPIWAIGFGQVDAELPHLHPNALVTLMSLLYAPRSRPVLVGAPKFKQSWCYPAIYPKGEEIVQRLIVGSCSMFDAESPYARVLGKEMTDYLVEEHVMGDFVGVFIAGDGRILEPSAPSMTVSHILASDLHAFSRRDDAIVLLASAGGEKVRLMRHVLEAGLCNTVITDDGTAAALLA